MEIDKLSKLKEEPHLSGAYIRNLVKQLTSSRTKDPMNPKDPDYSSTVDGDGFPGQNLTKYGETKQAQQQTQQPQQHKKQVRRRLHTSRPYQERLLNMAEARREIVTALKFHRAAMKQASEQQQQQQQKTQQEQEQEQQQQQQSQPLQPAAPPPHPCFEQESGRIKSRRNPRIYPSSAYSYSNYLGNLSYSNFSPRAPYPSFPWPPPASPISPPPFAENLNFTLPNQPLGLNLNFHDFNDLDTSLYYTSNNNLSLYSSSSPSSSSSPTVSIATDQKLPNSVAISQLEVGTPPPPTAATGSSTGGGLHAAMDDEEIAEIRSIGEQHQMEWNDTMNLVTSAWWFKFLKTMEVGGPEVKQAEEDIDGYHPFDEVLEFPAWLNANENCLQQHLNDYFSEEYFQDPALPRMDIGEIEGMDGEWLA